MKSLIIPYSPSFKEQCLSLFVQNTPPFFAPNEQKDYKQFLEDIPETYYVITAGENNSVVGAFGLQRIGLDNPNPKTVKVN
jgi:hypothetical protein